MTGGSGFIGSHLIPRLENSGHVVSLLLRDSNFQGFKQIKTFHYDLSKNENSLDKAFQNIDVVIHLASKVHDLKNQQSLDEYIQINLNGTQQLINAAVKFKVKRFIFLSTVKVHGDGELENITEHSIINPEDPYAISKSRCEESIRSVCTHDDLEYVIIRPPLVYGPGVKANFYNLIRLAESGVPLPFASIKNNRSMIYVENLCDFITQCVTDYNAKNETFLVKDYDISTSKLINMFCKYLDKPNRLFSIPSYLLKLLASVFQKQKQISRLVGSLSIDNDKMIKQLSWHPIYTLDKAIEKTIKWYKDNKSS